MSKIIVLDASRDFVTRSASGKVRMIYFQFCLDTYDNTYYTVKVDNGRRYATGNFYQTEKPAKKYFQKTCQRWEEKTNA